MNATAQPKKRASAAGEVELPSARQMIMLALAQAEHGLASLGQLRCHDEDWADCDVDVDNATELSLHHIRRMQAMDLHSYEGFDAEWYIAASAINLAKRSFSRSDCRYSRALECTCELFRVMAEAVEFADLTARRAGLPG